jgi:putative tributyrin esterase
VRLRLALLALVFLISALACSKREPPAPSDHPRLNPSVRLEDAIFHSASLQRDMPYRVILPVTLPSDSKLPVVYLLHGGGGDYREWSNDSDVSQFAKQGLILVMPEGNSSYYMNASERPQDRYEDYITEDLISDVENRFPVAAGRANRALVGVSMGGFGAVVLSLKHPGLYAFAGGISSAIDVPTRPFSLKRIGQYRGHAQIFGPWGSDTRRVNNPYFLAETVDPSQSPYLYLTCGEQEGLLPANKRFAGMLRKRRFQHEFHSRAGGHNWNQWNGLLPELFETLLTNMKRGG